MIVLSVNAETGEAKLSSIMRDIWVQLNSGIRELTRQITLEDILNTYQRHDAENGIFDYCI